MVSLQHTRRDFLKSSIGLAGLSVPSLFSLVSQASTQAPKAKSCIVLYTWGGMSHYESFDPKPNAPSDIRGEFKPIPTATPGIQFCEHLPLLAKHSEKMAIVRSIHHRHGGHQQGMYVSLTGHDPEGGLKAKKRNNWPSLTSMISRFNEPLAGTPRAIKLPYSMYDNGTLMAGDYGGWLGSAYDPVIIKTPAGEPFQGVTRYTDKALNLKLNVKKNRIKERSSLLHDLDNQLGTKNGTGTEYDHCLLYTSPSPRD